MVRLSMVNSPDFHLRFPVATGLARTLQNSPVGFQGSVHCVDFLKFLNFVEVVVGMDGGGLLRLFSSLAINKV